MCTISLGLNWMWTVFLGCSPPSSPLPESQISTDIPSRQIRYAFKDATWQGWVRTTPTATQSKILIFNTPPSIDEWTQCLNRLPHHSDYILISGTIENIALTKRYQQQVHSVPAVSQFNCE